MSRHVVWQSCQSPVAHSCSLRNHPNSSYGGCSSLMQNLMQIHCSTCSVILNVTATQYTCSLNSVYHPHWLVQWSRHCSHMCIPGHSPWLPGYMSVTGTILVILTMAVLLSNRPCVSHMSHCLNLKCTTCWLDILICCKMITTIVLVNSFNTS